MTTPDKAQQPEQDPQELTDEDLDQASGGNGPLPGFSLGVDSKLEGATVEGASVSWLK